MKTTIPNNALKFLRWFCREDYLDEIEGDLIELFDKRCEDSVRQAKWRFVWDVVKSFRPRNLKSMEFLKSNSMGMMRSNVKIAFRVFKREKLFTTINVLCLALGLAISLLIIQYARFEMSYESMHPYVDRTVRLTVNYMDGETVVEQDCETYPAVGPKILADMPEVIDFARTYHLDLFSVDVGENQFAELTMYAADPSFFIMFDYPLIHGELEGLFKAPFETVLSESTALRFFDRVDVVGETIRVKGDDGDVPVTVKGIIPDSPVNTHLKFDMLVSYETLLVVSDESNDNWNGNNTLTYVLLDENVDYGVFTEKLASFDDGLRKEEYLFNERIIGQKIGDIHLYSKKSFETEPNGDAASVHFLLLVAFMVILSAFANYINLSTSKSLDRAREVGIRKVVGSTKGHLRVQFLTESVLINLFAGLLAVILIIFSKDYFIYLSGVPKGFEIFTDPMMWYLLTVFVVAGVVFSGIYPAIVLSSFKPITVLKGKFQNSSKGIVLRKSLVVFQFAITLILLCQTFIIHQQMDFMRNLDLGFDMDRTLVVTAPAGDTLRQNYAVFKEQLLNQSAVQSVALSDMLPGQGKGMMSSTTGVRLHGAEENSFNYYLYWIDEDFVPAMGVNIIAGENFDINKSESNSVLVNEELLKLWGIAEPNEIIGKKIKVWGDDEKIVKGVVKNFHHESPKSAHFPLILLHTRKFGQFASIKLNPGDPRDQVAMVEELFDSNFPNTAFTSYFLDQDFDREFRADEQFRAVFDVMTGFAIFIACLGLFGLASFTVAKRTKEIGIRKVVGASVTDIVKLLSGGFLRTVIIGMIIGMPITWWIVTQWLNSYANRVGLDFWMFAVPGLLIVSMAFVSVSINTIKISLSNPVDSLRDE